jgi:PAS domain S-box-containing protein
MSTLNSHPVRPNDQLEHSLLSAWLNAADVGMCVIDDTSRVVMLNPAACRMLGVDGLAMLNHPLRSMLEATNLEPSLLQWMGAMGFDGERHITRNHAGGPTQLLLKSSTLRAGTGALFKMVAITDVTALLAAQQHIDSEASRRHWQALNAGVVISDAQLPDMPIVYANPMFERISGYSLAEMLGRNCRFLQGVDKDQPGLLGLREAIRNQTNGYAELRNYRKDGSLFINELFISPVRDGAGVVTHFVGIQHLLTDTPGKQKADAAI